MLELRNVKKIYKSKSGNVTALNGIDITFPETGMLFISGKSGCGKTTLLNVIGGLDGIDDGEISLLGKSFKDFTTEEYDSYRNTFIGFVFQEYNLLNEYTVEKNIQIAMELQGITCDKTEFDALLEKVEITQLKNRKPNELSGGQTQRVAIARALVKKPRIIIADEPTGALDSNTGIQVLDILKKLSKEKLIIVVSHDREFAEKYADRLIRLVDGNIIEDVTFSENEIEENIKEQDSTLIVKNGATLNEKEKDLLANAVKDKKKIEIIEKLSYREKFPTGEVVSVKSNQPIELKKSKMKFKSAFSLGLKSLAVKPLRLIFTVLLSAVAFSVFGLFDTIANFNTADVIHNQLKKSDVPSITASTKYIVNSALDDKYSVKISDEKIKELEKDTGYSIKGIYHLNRNSYGNAPNGYDIREITETFTNRGKNFYTNKIDGLIEFSADEIDSNGKIKSYNYQIINGRYPDTVKEIAISTHLAECIIYYLNGNPLNGKQIEEVSDLLGSKITVYINESIEFTIVGLIDCGNIPDKYLPLMNSYENETKYQSLAYDFRSFINSGAQRCLFMPDGYREWYKTSHNETATVFFAGYASWTIGREKQSNLSYVYSADKYDSDKILRFDNVEDNCNLKDDEVLIHISNLPYLFKSESQGVNVSNYIEVIKESSYTLKQKEESLSNFFKAIGLNKSQQIKTVNLTKAESTTDNKISKDVKVVGVYFGVENFAYQQPYKLMMNGNLMSEFNIYNEQGDFSRIMFSPKGNLLGTKKIAEYMNADSGFALDWYNNTAILTISQNEQTIRQSADLFLYASIVLAIFSIFMFFNYIATSVVNKRQTIGILRCLGSNGKNILTIFTIESIVMAIINGILATAITALGCMLVNMYIMNVMNIGIAFAIFGIRQFSIIFGISLLTAILSSAFPIIKISKEKPVDLIRKP